MMADTDPEATDLYEEESEDNDSLEGQSEQQMVVDITQVDSVRT